MDKLLTKAEEALGGQFVGMYLFGSLANGGFDWNSDVDVLIVTDDEISDEIFEALKAMHVEIAGMESWCAIQLEVSYIPRKALRCYDPKNKVHPHIDRGKNESLFMMQHDRDWVVQRHTLRGKGITIAGPTPRSLIDPVTPDDLRGAMLEILNDWWAGLLDDPSQISHRGYQSYTVLSLCRLLYTLQFGEVTSKQASAEWAKKTLDKHWIPLIENAWAGRQHPGSKAKSDDINETLEFIRYAIIKSRQYQSNESNA